VRRLWSIYTNDIQAHIGKVEYGVLPQGFTQISPSAGRPEALEEGRMYSVAARGKGLTTRNFTLSGNGGPP
jgi:hypothetical protein